MEKIKKYAALTTKEKIKRQILTSTDINESELLNQIMGQKIDSNFSNQAINDKFNKLRYLFD